MIKYNELKVGDFVNAEYEGQLWEGEVTRLNGDEKQVCVETSVQEFWFEPEHLFPIALTDGVLKNLNFTSQEMPDGSVKYMKGSFRIVTPSLNDFSSIEMWYREDRRHHPDVHYLHQLQNHYYEMTKITLTKQLV